MDTNSLVGIGIVFLAFACIGVAFALRGNLFAQVMVVLNQIFTTLGVIPAGFKTTLIQGTSMLSINTQQPAPTVVQPQVVVIPAMAVGAAAAPAVIAAPPPALAIAPPPVPMAGIPIIAQTGAGTAVVITVAGVPGAGGLLVEFALNGAAYAGAIAFLAPVGGSISLPFGVGGIVAGATIRARAAITPPAGAGPAWSADSGAYTIV